MQYLDIRTKAKLYGTNNRLLCAKLVAPGVIPCMVLDRSHGSAEAHLLRNNTGLLDCTLDFYERTIIMKVSPVSAIPTLKWILCVNSRSLTTLSITFHPPDFRHSDDEPQSRSTLASLFPDIRHLVILRTYWYMPFQTPQHIEALAASLPRKLKTLKIMEDVLRFPFDALPSSLTYLEIPKIKWIEWSNIDINPTLSLVQQLSERCPQLTHLSTSCPKDTSNDLFFEMAMPSSSKLANLGEVTSNFWIPQEIQALGYFYRLGGIDSTRDVFYKDVCAPEWRTELKESKECDELQALKRRPMALSPHLKYLIIGTDGYTQDLFDLVESAPNLVSLTIDSCNLRLGSPLTQLKHSRTLETLKVTCQARYPLELAPGFFRSLPASLSSLHLDHVFTSFSRPSQIVYDRLYPNHDPSDENLNWLSLLPPNVVCITLARVDAQLELLPRHLESFVFETTIDRISGSISSLPSTLTVLDLSWYPLSRSDIHWLPKRLRTLSIALEPGWTCQHILGLVERLPLCMASFYCCQNLRRTLYTVMLYFTTEDMTKFQKHTTLAELARFVLGDVFGRVKAFWLFDFPAPQVDEGSPSTELVSCLTTQFTILPEENSLLRLSTESVERLLGWMRGLEILDIHDAFLVHSPFLISRPTVPEFLILPSFHEHTSLVSITILQPVARFSFQILPRCLTRLQLRNVSCGYYPTTPEWDVSELPRNLNDLEVPFIQLCSDQHLSLWPSSIRCLSFDVSKWTDWRLLELKAQLKELKTATFPQGELNLTGKLPGVPIDLVKSMFASIYLNRTRKTLTEEELEVLESPSIQRCTMETLVHLSPLIPADAISKVRFRGSNEFIRTLCERAETALVLAFDSKVTRLPETVPLRADSSGLRQRKEKFEICRMRHLLTPSVPRFTSVAPGIDYSSVVFSQSLTVLNLGITPLKSGILQQLPSTLTRLSAITTGTAFPTLISLLPRELIHLAVDSENSCDLVQTEINSLPKTLQMLHLRNVTFSPSLIKEIPTKLSELTFQGDLKWTKDKIQSLASQLGARKWEETQLPLYFAIKLS